MASIYKWLNNKKRLSIYLTTFSNFSKAVVLYFATIFLYKIDNSGASSGFLVLLGLLAVSLSGMIAPFLIIHFKGFKLGILLSMVSLVAEFLFFIFYQQKIPLYCCIVVINLIQGIESANYNYELVDIFENDVEDQIQSNNGYHILLQTFTLIAPILGYLLVNYCIVLASCVVVLFLQLVALIAWFILKKYEPLNKSNVDIPKYPFKNYLLAIKNKNVVFLNLVRSANGFVFNTWEIAAPMVIMAIAENQAQLSSKIQTTYETTLSIAFILSGAFLG
ncbi:hypothetical protein [Bombilactobacillus thymidiniphilus]|uniref:MFS transporter n=1 Tax=Bombilactobacillus thymidiniphilus TaxID=2923363 RepID=A0ABY4PCV5_9LACO|nr:hypothetical protein [Bombilactobacillus thymidiniphilus]UQS83600.1 hypothetical protein MOO47_07505 [Bombilactobacillus thymidiniphilus]UQS83647.1 hypothetical protein MOO47_00125 [Bombilactobacillus thymidiniphilus]